MTYSSNETTLENKMKILNDEQMESVKINFPLIADFGINAIQVHGDEIRMFTSYAIPSGCGYDEDLVKLENMCLEMVA